MTPIIRITLFMTAYLLVTAYALGKGGRPERGVAVTMTGGLLLTWFVIAPLSRRYAGPDYGVALVDTVMLVAFVWFALRADRFWLLWLGAMQGVIVLCHVAVVLKPMTMPAYYLNTVQLWSYPQLALLAVGTLRHRLRVGASPWEAAIGDAARRLARRLSHERTATR